MILALLPNLEEVHLVAPLEDHHVRILARAWPRLRRFTLRTPPLETMGTSPHREESLSNSLLTGAGSGEGERGKMGRWEERDASAIGAAFLEPRTTVASLGYLATFCPLLEHIAMDLAPPCNLEDSSSLSSTVSLAIRPSSSTGDVIPGPSSLSTTSVHSPACPTHVFSDLQPTTTLSSLPCLPPTLRSLHITGFSSLSPAAIYHLATRVVPSLCDVRIERIALGGLADLFRDDQDETDVILAREDEEGMDQKRAWNDGTINHRDLGADEWKVKIQRVKEDLERSRPRGWHHLGTSRDL